MQRLSGKVFAGAQVMIASSSRRDRTMSPVSLLPRSRRFWQAAVIALCCMLAACVTAPPSEIGEFDEGNARTLAEAGNFRGAALEYQRMAGEDRQNRAALLLRAAESLREEGDWQAVLQVVDRIQRDRLTDSQILRLELLLVEAALARDDVEGAWARLQLLPEATQTGARSRQLELRARALAARGDLIGSARVRLEIAPLLDPRQQRSNEADIVAALARIPAPELQQQFDSLEREDPLRPLIEEALRKLGATPIRRLPQPTHAVGGSQAAEDGDWQREGYARIERVALLLPLTGPLAAAGRAVRDGVLAAHFSDRGERAEVSVLDTGSTAQSAVEAYVDAVTAGAQRVIGPLSREQVAALFSQRELPVPVLALNAPEDDAPPPPGHHLFGLAPEEEGAAIAQRLKQGGFTSPLVLVSREDWSLRSAQALASYLRLDGIEVAAPVEVPSGVDFRQTLEQARAQSFDSVVIALRPQQARLLRAQWREAVLPQVRWLATSHVYAGSSNASLDRDLDGIEFLDAPWLSGLNSVAPTRSSLKRELPSADAAPRLFALGLDAYRLTPYLDWLQQHPEGYLSGANGQLTVDPEGRVRRLPAWLQFSNGQPRATQGALFVE